MLRWLCACVCARARAREIWARACLCAHQEEGRSLLAPDAASAVEEDLVRFLAHQEALDRRQALPERPAIGRQGGLEPADLRFVAVPTIDDGRASAESVVEFGRTEVRAGWFLVGVE